MPRVGKKHFPYSKKGVAAARAYAKRTGRRVSYTKKGKTWCDARSHYPTNSKKKKAVIRSKPKTLADVYNRLL